MNKVVFHLLKKVMKHSAKAEISNNQFSSAFTIYNSKAEPIPSFESPSFPDMLPIQIEIDDVSQLLQKLYS